MKLTKKLIFISLLPLFLLTIGAVFSGLSLQLSHKATQHYIDEYVARKIHISHIFKHMGFDRGIHAFKNYVLRGEEAYRKNSLTEWEMALTEIEGYKSLPYVTKEEIKLLTIVETTILAYKEKIALIRKLREQGQPILVIDHLVKIDDTPASNALAQLQSIVTQKRLSEASKVSEVQNQTFISIICLFIIALLLSIFLSKKISTKIVNSLKKLLHLSQKIEEGDYHSNGLSLDTFAEDEIKGLASQMINMNHVLKESFEELKIKNEELKHFAFTTSHDLQEPIKKIATYSGLLRYDLGEKLSGEASLYMKEIEISTLRMQNLIRSLLKLSQLNHSEIKFEKVDLNQIMEINIKKFQEEILESNAQINYKMLPHVEGNEELLESLFQNLISNAIKYRSDKRALIIEVDSEVLKDSKKTKITFSDNGIGIAQKDLPKIYRPFSRLNPESLQKGQGIGLYQCKKIIELHGGKIEVTSQEDVGVKFSFELKLV